MFNIFDVASIELLVNTHGTAHERKVWQTLKAHCTQPTDVQQVNTAIALAERYCDSCLSHSAEERMTMFRFTMWVREQQQ